MRKPWAMDDRHEGMIVERARREPSALDRATRAFLSILKPSWSWAVPKWSPVVRRALAGAKRLQAEPDDALPRRAETLRLALRRDGFSKANVADAFALGIEATRRVHGFVLHPVQVAGAEQILAGRLCEMATGEGKTVTAILPAVAASLAGARVHVVTVNEYLAERDSEEVRPVHALLGLTVGLVKQEMADTAKAEAYLADITYVTSQSLAFDYLRDRLDSGGQNSAARHRVSRIFHQRAQLRRIPGLIFSIVDEADSVLIDEARTPLIISGEAPDDGFGSIGAHALDLAREMQEPEHFTIDRATSRVTLTDAGREAARTGTAGLPRMVTALIARDELIERALTALHLYHLGQHYILTEGKIGIVDESTGRVMPDRQWEHGLHQMIEMKEGCEASARRETLTQITFQRFFRKYLWFGGMSGTATPVAREIQSVYDLPVVRIPTNAKVRRRNRGTTFCRDDDAKWQRVVRVAQAQAARGRPVLIGTRSVAASDALKAAFDAAGATTTLLNARQDKEEAEIVAAAGQPGRITIATNMAGRGTDIKLSPEARRAGGLHVILTEFHESARVDRQLFGRAGRQGDPGSCEAIVARTDALFRRFAPRATAMIGPAARLPGLQTPLVAALRSVAQMSAGRYAARARMQTLRNDEQLEKSLSFARPM